MVRASGLRHLDLQLNSKPQTKITKLTSITMRIISGKFKGRRFIPPADDWPTRPTTDFAKEGLFNILNNNIDFTETTNSDGGFILGFPAMADVIKELEIINNEYEIVEKEDVRNLNTIGDITNNPIIVLVCKKGELKKLSDQYFDVLVNRRL